jgi:hypothetical protein
MEMVRRSEEDGETAILSAEGGQTTSLSAESGVREEEEEDLTDDELLPTLDTTTAGGHVVSACAIVGGGYVFREGVGILIHRASHNTISDNEIGHLGYTGVSVGWEWGYAVPSGASHNAILRNFIHHIGRCSPCSA